MSERRSGEGPSDPVCVASFYWADKPLTRFPKNVATLLATPHSKLPRVVIAVDAPAGSVTTQTKRTIPAMIKRTFLTLPPPLVRPSDRYRRN